MGNWTVNLKLPVTETSLCAI